MASKGHQPHLDSSLPGLETQKHRSPQHQRSRPRSETRSQAETRLKPAIVALYRAGKKLNYLNRHIFELPLLARLDLKSHEQTAWINLHTPTVRQAQAEAVDKLQKTQRDIQSYFILSAPAPAVAPCPPAEQAPNPGGAGPHPCGTGPCPATNT